MAERPERAGRGEEEDKVPLRASVGCDLTERCTNRLHKPQQASQALEHARAVNPGVAETRSSAGLRASETNDALFR